MVLCDLCGLVFDEGMLCMPDQAIWMGVWKIPALVVYFVDALLVVYSVGQKNHTKETTKKNTEIHGKRKRKVIPVFTRG